MEGVLTPELVTQLYRYSPPLLCLALAVLAQQTRQLWAPRARGAQPFFYGALVGALQTPLAGWLSAFSVDPAVFLNRVLYLGLGTQFAYWHRETWMNALRLGKFYRPDEETLCGAAIPPPPPKEG